MPGDSVPFYELLDEASDLNVSIDTAAASNPTYRLDGTSDHGTYAVWIDPEYDHHVVHARVAKNADDLVWNGQTLKELRYQRMEIEVSDVEFSQFEGRAVPVQFRSKFSRFFRGSRAAQHFHQRFRVEDISFEVDSASANRFFDSFDGVLVRDSTNLRPPRYYVWTDNKLSDDPDRVKEAKSRYDRQKREIRDAMLAKRPVIYDEDADGRDQILDALDRAKRENKLVLITWGQNSCGWCQFLEHMTKENEQVEALRESRYVTVHVDVTDDKHSGLMREYGVEREKTRLPHMTILNAHGDVLHQKKPLGISAWQDDFGLTLDETRLLEFLNGSSRDWKQ